MGSRAGLQLTRRHNNFLPLFKSPISLAPPFGGSCWAVRALHTGTSSHLGQLGHVQGPIGMRELLPRLLQGPRQQQGHPAGHFLNLAPLQHCCLLTQGPQCSGRAKDDAEAGKRCDQWVEAAPRPPTPTRANSGQRWLLLAPGSQGTVWHCQLLQGQEAQETLPLAWWGRVPLREAAPPKEGCPGLVARREPV